MAGTDNLLELDNITVVKGGTRVLDGLTLTVRAGEHTAILGPNGAGKTTFINLLTHDDYPFTGDSSARSLRVFGHDRWDVFDLRSQLGIITSDLHQRFVDGNSTGQIRGEDAVLSGFFATRGFIGHRVVTAAMRQEAARALALLDSAHLAPKPLGEMSTGEARRVLIARALVTKPRALVLDEPTGGLDVVARQRFLITVRRLAREGTTIVLVTHHVEEIIPEIEHVILIRRGRVAAQGSKTSILTTAHLSAVFEAPIAVDRVDGYYYARA